MLLERVGLKEQNNYNNYLLTAFKSPLEKYGSNAGRAYRMINRRVTTTKSNFLYLKRERRGNLIEYSWYIQQ